MIKKIFLIVIGLSVAVWADFSRDNAAQIVTDNSTGLQWQDDTNISNKSWMQAIEYCEGLTLGTHTDWRLPNFNELYTINELKAITKKDLENPNINGTFQNVLPKGYWSSTTLLPDMVAAWVVNFGNYDESSAYKPSFNSVRCVRGGE